MRVIVTRPGPQAGQWVSALREAGIDALALPLIEIAGPPDPDAIRAAWRRLQELDAVMFVSANAVAQFFALQPAAAPAFAADTAEGPRFFVTGPGSLAALLKSGVPRSQIDAPDVASAQFDSEALWCLVQAQVRPGWRVLIVRGNTEAGEESEPAQGVGRDWFAARLREQGAEVEFLVAYVRRAPVLNANALALVQVAAADGTVWLFSSSEAVANLLRLLPDQRWQQARAVATHPRIAATVRRAGFGLVCESRPPLEALMASIESMP